jgi:hypothetical protein
MELEQAVPFLVPFLIWARARGKPAESSRLEEFLDDYDPHAPQHWESATPAARD